MQVQVCYCEQARKLKVSLAKLEWDSWNCQRSLLDKLLSIGSDQNDNWFGLLPRPRDLVQGFGPEVWEPGS